MVEKAAGRGDMHGWATNRGHAERGSGIITTSGLGHPTKSK